MGNRLWGRVLHAQDFWGQWSLEHLFVRKRGRWDWTGGIDQQCNCNWSLNKTQERLGSEFIAASVSHWSLQGCCLGAQRRWCTLECIAPLSKGNCWREMQLWVMVGSTSDSRGIRCLALKGTSGTHNSHYTLTGLELPLLYSLAFVSFFFLSFFSNRARFLWLTIAFSSGDPLIPMLFLLRWCLRILYRLSFIVFQLFFFLSGGKGTGQFNELLISHRPVNKESK